MRISIVSTATCTLLLPISIGLVAGLTGSQAHAQALEQCPSPAPASPKAVISEKALADVCIPTGFHSLPIDFFDDYSWRAFLGLVWPAKPGERGMPDASAKLSDSGRPLVFETFKSDWEIFQPDGAAPAAWNTVGGANPCKLAGVSSDDLVLAAFSKFNNLGQAGFTPRLVGPLVAQNRTYVRFQTAFNKTEFDQIDHDKLYLRDNLKGTMTFQPGAIDIKAAWIDMTGIAHPERFYTRAAYLIDLATEACSKSKVGLVGLHIVQKTPSRPQWIWSSFEQVDNIVESDSQAPATFNADNNEPMPDENPYGFPPPVQVPAAFNVDRLKPIHENTVRTNEIYRKLLAEVGVPWQFYKLVVTQWPIPVASPAVDGNPNNTFPGKGLDQSAFANLTMETFDQKKTISGCMNCHNVTRKTTDFLWSLNTRAFPPIQAVTAHAALAEKSVTTLALPNTQLKNWAQVLPANESFQLPAAQLSEFQALKELMEAAQSQSAE
ncbi:hypothetical protein HFO89_10990 [Rhizobium leguminosarum]|uniref:hypothetical protein n=1 Tax=Rhizobium leguminosarum TaxID=384 RepID=UPI001C959472|nr:hypothetical protein [Rhizobium leguminosarum]MBY5456885.1 hypothetical protein [Rhizobium leguminosarum]